MKTKPAFFTTLLSAICLTLVCIVPVSAFQAGGDADIRIITGRKTSVVTRGRRALRGQAAARLARGALRQQEVEINEQLLKQLVSIAERAGVEGQVQSRQTVTFNLFERRTRGANLRETSFTGTVEYASKQSNDTSVLRGTLNNTLEGLFTIIIHKGLLGLRVFSPRGNYSLRPSNNDPSNYIVVQEDPNSAFPCKVVSPGKHRREGRLQLSSTLTENGSLVDVLVVYTTGAKDYYNGNVANLERAVREMEEFTNLALRKSLPDVLPPTQVRFVAIEEVPNTIGDSLEDYAFNSPGAPIRQKREFYKADLVVVLRRTMVWAGQAFAMCDLESPNFYARRGYAHVRIDYLEQIKTMPHEIGHLFGDQHDPDNIDSCSLYRDSRGHFFPARDEQGVLRQYATILSYTNAFNRIPGYSNPDVLYLRVPTGKSGERNNARAMRDSRLQLSNYMQSNNPNPTPIGQPPVISILSPANGAQLPGNARITISAKITDDEAVMSADLFWQQTNNYLRCPGGNNEDWSCTKDGDTYNWVLTVGTGMRNYQVRAADARGNITQSPFQTLNLMSP